MASLTWLGHASFEIELNGSVIYTDPWFNVKPRENERLVMPSVKSVDAIRKADVILVSHEHFDHCDAYDTTRIAQRTFATVVGPEEALAKLHDISPRVKMVVNEGDSFVLHGLNIRVTPARHPQSVNPVGFVVEKGGKSIYFAGDTYEFHDMTNINVDVALIPIGGTYTMDILGAVGGVKRMQAKFAVPMHFNTFSQIKADPHEFAQRLKGGKTEVKVLEIGQSLHF